MKRKTIIGKFVLVWLVLIALGVLLVPSAHAVDDVTPPVLVDFSFTPTTVDVTGGPANVTFTFHVTDNLSGVQSGGAQLVSPSGTQRFGGSIVPPPLSGTTLDGVYQLVVSIPQFVEQGTWSVEFVNLTDAVGNGVSITTAQLQVAGFPTELTVVSTQDTSPPALVEFSFTPTAVDVTGGPANVTFTFHVTDNLSGVQSGGAQLVSPSGTQRFGGSIVPPPLSGTTLDGVYQLVVSIPQFVEQGTWSVEFVNLTDAVGNGVSITTAQLQVAGFPTQLIVQPQFVFPKTGVLDNFNRANGALGSNWSGSSDKGDYRIANNQVDVRDGGPIYWKPSSFGADQEAFVKLTTVDSKAKAQGLLLKAQGSQGNWRKGAIAVLYDAKANGGVAAVRLRTFRPGTSDWFAYPAIPVTFQNGDQFGARALANGDVQIVKNGTLVGTVSLNAADQGFFNSKEGRIGLWFVKAGNAFFDDFGGGSVTP